MVNIILAFTTTEQCKLYAGVLEGAGYQVFRCCTSAGEVKRALSACYDGLVICASRLPDSTVDALAWDLGKRALMLVIGRAENLALCEHPDIFRLKTPCGRAEMISAVNMLAQLHRMRLPRRSAGEDQVILRAKRYLMETQTLTEPEAHRRLQQRAMRSGQKLAECAAQLLEGK